MSLKNVLQLYIFCSKLICGIYTLARKMTSFCLPENIIVL